MEIEILTTKKKLNKSLVNQFSHADSNVIKNGVALGFVINIIKDSYKALLIKCGEEYFYFPTNWTKGTTNIYRHTSGRFSVEKKFDDAEKCDLFWASYQELLSSAKDQIFI